jgi:hypothetical protein
MVGAKPLLDVCWQRVGRPRAVRLSPGARCGTSAHVGGQELGAQHKASALFSNRPQAVAGMIAILPYLIPDSRMTRPYSIYCLRK